MLSFRIIFLAAVVALGGCSQAPLVTVRNNSGVTLSNVVVSAAGFSNRIASIAPGGQRRLALQARGEFDLRFTCDAAGLRIDSGGHPFGSDGGYKIVATVRTNLEVVLFADYSGY